MKTQDRAVWIWIALLLMSLAVSCSGAAEEKMAPADVRRMAAAGRFYPRAKEVLQMQVDDLLEASPVVEMDGEIIGLVCPHAGYEYSGQVAANAFKQIAGKDYEIVVVIGPSHLEPFIENKRRLNGISVYGGDGYETPLGTIYVDKELAGKIVAHSEKIILSNHGHWIEGSMRQEHCLEVELPFLQRTLKDFKIVPIIMDQQTYSYCQVLGEALAKTLSGRKALIVASSDLYHGYSYEECVRIDNRTLEVIERFEPGELSRGLHNGTYQACGGGPIVAMLFAARQLGADKAKVIARTNSNDVTGERGGYVVGYGAVVIYRSGKMEKKSRGKASPQRDQARKVEYEPLNREAQQELLRMARATIEGYLKSGETPAFEPKFEVLKDKRGVFVTLTEHGRLRGCIGHHESDVPLYKLVPDMAVAAAFRDPRFRPLSKEELDDVRIKVSVYLTNVYRIEDLSEFEIGEHGIIMMKGDRGATYLPEVPIEAGWTTAEEEMEHLCRKAGLPRGAWREGAEFYVYRTQVFGEGE